MKEEMEDDKYGRTKSVISGSGYGDVQIKTKNISHLTEQNRSAQNSLSP